MTAEYKLSSDAPYSIIVEGEGSLEPFVEIMGGKLIETMTGDIVEIPFTAENATKLRHYLKGRDVEIAPREKAILAYIADNPEALDNEDIIWSTQLTDLLKYPAPGKFRKIKTGWDLIHYMPLRYLDKSNPQSVAELVVGEWGVIIGTVAAKPEYKVVKGHDFVKIVVSDVNGQRISATFFRQKWLQWVFKEGDEVVLYGNYSEFVNNRQQRFPQLTNAKIDKMGTLRGQLAMVPIYPQRQEDKSLQLQNAQKELIDRIVWIEDPVPATILKKYNLVSRNEAYKKIHFPETPQDVEDARTRIAFDEFVRLQVFLLQQKTAIESSKGTAKKEHDWAEQFIKSLPFDLTPGQLSVIEEIKQDMAKEEPMYRLLQGDVGSGKAQPLYSKVLTPQGFTTIEELQVGDSITTPHSSTATIIGIYPQGTRSVYELTFSDGSKVHADENHLWQVQEPGASFVNKTTLELKNDLHFQQTPYHYKWSIPNMNISGVGGEWDKAEEPYVWGFKVLNSNPELLSTTVLNYNETVRKLILQGIIDQSDDSYYEPVTKTYEISLKSETQLIAFKHVVKSVGGSCQPVNPDSDILRVTGKIHNPDLLKIMNIQYVGEKETQCIKLDTEEGLYITDDYIVTHNTEISSVATLFATQAGYQTALLAPTDILATQLKNRLSKTFLKAGFSKDEICVELINGKTLGKKRKELLERLANNEINVLVGTHAIISSDVEFANLGLVVVDEQHKFGSEQRNKLKEKKTKEGYSPDFLMMSATPIPRTVSQVVYGDMDISIVEGIPSERQPIETAWVETPDIAWAKIREEVEQGHQAYVVAALVEESDKLENVEAAESTYLLLANKIFPDFNVGLMHGKLKPQEKEEVINSFLNGTTQILVATSVVEVGVNVPNATVMTILNSNRFGISSLHQIRGRVGRGNLKSYCYLVGEATTPEAEERLTALVESTDGFWLSEKDLEIRGEGSLFGQLQSGANDMFVGNLREHKDMLEKAKNVAKQASSSIMLNKEVKLLYEGKTISA